MIPKVNAFPNEDLFFGLQAAKVAVWMWNVLTDELTFSDNAAEVYGFDPADPPTNTKALLALLHPEDYTKICQELAGVMSEARAFSTEIRIMTRTGEVQWLSVQGRSFSDDLGHIVRLRGVSIDISEAKGLEEQVLKSQRQLAEAQRLAGVGSWEWEIASNTVTFSAEAYSLLGITPGSPVCYGTWLQAVHPADRAAADAMIEQALEQQQPFQGQYRLLLPDNTVRVHHGQGEIIVSEDGKASLLRGTMQDISAQRETERELKKSRRFLAEAQRIAGIGSWEWNSDTNHVTWSDEQYHLFGLPLGSPVSPKTFLQAVHPDDRASAYETMVTARADQQPFEFTYRVLTASGSERVFHERGEVVRDSSSGAVIVRGTTQDLTAQKQIEQELFKALERYELAAKVTNDLIWEWDVQADEFLFDRETFQHLFGYDTSGTADLKSWLALVARDEQETVRADLLRTLHSSQTRYAAKYRLRHADGSLRHVKVEGFIIRHAQGQALRIVGATSDISAEERTQQEQARHTRQQQAVAELGLYALSKPEPSALFEQTVTTLSSTLEGASAEVLEAFCGKRSFALRASSAPVEAPQSAAASQAGSQAVSQTVPQATYTLRSGEAVIVSDYRSETRFAPSATLLEQGVKTSMSVIIRGQSQPYGVLCVYSSAPRPYQQDDVLFLQAIANVLAPTIEQYRLMQQLEHQARHDTLTGLPNRRMFEHKLEQAILEAQQQQQLVAVLFIDLDSFKSINDTLGHQAGDDCLREVARRLKRCVREVDTLARLGGDEFVLLLSGLKEAAATTRVTQQLLQTFSKPFVIEGKKVLLSCTVGVSLYPQDGDSSSVLLRHADSAMYGGKSLGKNNVQFFTHEQEGKNV